MEIDFEEMGIHGLESLGDLASPLQSALAALDRERTIERIWQRDPGVWGKGPAEVVDRLGWLDLPEQLTAARGELAAFAEEVRSAGFTDVVLLGMGGSSLGAEVLRSSFPRVAGAPRLTVLDSTVPAWVTAVRQAIDPATTLFLVGSKSGTTAEINAFYHFFWAETVASVGAAAGGHFVAITDPGTALAKLAAERGFRRTFENRPDLGGRFSVLSHFGMVPAALLDLSLDRLLMRALSMSKASNASTPAAENLGARLGAILGVAARAGRDKATLLTSPALAAFGLWAEQLLAESTGKEGKGILPIAGEPCAAPGRYAADRLFVALRLMGDDNAALDAQVAALAAGGQPVVVLPLLDPYDLGGELFRWEFATAVAGHLLGIHPFDQPDVESSKRITRSLLTDYRATGALPEVAAGGSLATALAGAPASFVALMAYLGESRELETAVTALRARLLTEHGLATTFGYAPRMLHSTGQYHKGGPPGGLFVQLLPAHDEAGPAIPGEPYGFGTLAAAQAIGDARALEEKGRRCLRLRLAPPYDALAAGKL